MYTSKHYLRPSEAIAKLGCSKSAFWKWTRLPGFPKPYRFGSRYTAWADRDLDAWMETHKDPQHEDG